MRVISSLEELRSADIPGSGTVVAVGKFDGIHLGHRAIISSLKNEAEARGLASVVFTFKNSPLTLLRPDTYQSPLTSPAQRLELLEDAGVDYCVMIAFDDAFASIEPREFVEDLLVGSLGIKHAILGADFRFGHMGVGDSAMLRELGSEYGFTVEVVDKVNDVAHGGVSSSRIREAVKVGDVALAGSMLGRMYSVRGEVVHGDARGRELGFPTANLGGEAEGLVPADGVYAGTVVLDGVEHLAAISVGVNLTFDPEGEPRVEAHILDFEGDLYGQRMEVRFAERIRPMLPFETVEGLIARMHDDVTATRQLVTL